MRDIGKNIREIRQRKNLTQDQLAQRLFVTRQTISNYETGRSRPDIETLLALARELGCAPDHLLYGPPGREERRAAWLQVTAGVVALAALAAAGMVCCGVRRWHGRRCTISPGPRLCWGRCWFRPGCWPGWCWQKPCGCTVCP